MAINKNFVIKNGAEINTNLFVADSSTNKIGIGTTVPQYSLHVGGSRGGIGATDITIVGVATVGTSSSESAAFSVLGVSTFQGDVNFLGSAGVSTITFDASLDKLNFADNARATFGASDDLQIFHDGSKSIIRETGTGNLVIEGTGETLAVFTDDGGVSLYYDNTDVFQTTPQGINVTGVATALRLNVAGVATVGSLSIGSTEIVDTSFQLKNIASLDATTTATIETAIASGPNTFDDLKVTGITTLGFTTATTIEVGNEGLTVAGVTTQSGDLVVGVSTLFADVSSGRIGIGTAVPASTLDVDGSLTVNSAKVEDLTNNRVVIAGTDGELEDDANFTFDGTTLAVTGKETVSVDITVGSGVTIQNHGGLSVAGISTFGGLVNVDGGITANTAIVEDLTNNRVVIAGTSGELEDSANLTFDGAGLVVTGNANVSGVTTTATLAVTGIATAKTLIVGNEGLTVSGASTFSGQINAGTAATIATNGNASFSGIVTAAQFQGGGIGVGIGTTGDGSAGFHTVGFGFTFLDLKGPGISTVYANSSTGIATIFFQGGGTAGAAGTWTPEGSIGVSTSKSVGVNTVALNDPDVQGIGNSFQGLYIGNGMLLVDNALNGNHYIGTAKNGLMAGPVTINGVLTVDGNYVVV
tara:strand:- start:1727 stop:3655 length:1929 start_codon:yes stop_codon:yes gene_type:complete